jgi:hypothetical protein
MLLRPRKHPHSADEPVSPVDVAESLFAMGIMAWMIAPSPFLWAPSLWVMALMTPVERPTKAKLAAPVREERVAAAIAQKPPEPPIATPLQASPPALPRMARAPRPKRRRVPSRAKEPR